MVRTRASTAIPSSAFRVARTVATRQKADADASAFEFNPSSCFQKNLDVVDVSVTTSSPHDQAGTRLPVSSATLSPVFAMRRALPCSMNFLR